MQARNEERGSGRKGKKRGNMKNEQKDKKVKKDESRKKKGNKTTARDTSNGCQSGAGWLQSNHSFPFDQTLPVPMFSLWPQS